MEENSSGAKNEREVGGRQGERDTKEATFIIFFYLSLWEIQRSIITMQRVMETPFYKD